MEPLLDEPRRKFTVDEVAKMIASGVLDEADRVELIEGELLVMSPQDPPHASVIERLNGRLVALYADRHRVRVQLPLVASETSMPEPDFAVVRGDERAYETRHPTGRDTILVIEVSASSGRRDRRKGEIYGRAGVPVFWRLDVDQRRLEVCENPAGDGSYTLIRLYEEAAEVEVPGTGVRWRVADLLPAR